MKKGILAIVLSMALAMGSFALDFASKINQFGSYGVFSRCTGAVTSTNTRILSPLGINRSLTIQPVSCPRYVPSTFTRKPRWFIPSSRTLFSRTPSAFLLYTQKQRVEEGILLNSVSNLTVSVENTRSQLGFVLNESSLEHEASKTVAMIVTQKNSRLIISLIKRLNS